MALKIQALIKGLTMAIGNTTVSGGSCTILSSEATRCPLCKAHVAPGELHQCATRQVAPAPRKGRRR